MDAYQPLDERLFNALTVRWPAIALDTRLCLSVFCQFVGIGWINNTVVSEHLPVNVLERFALDEQVATPCILCDGLFESLPFFNYAFPSKSLFNQQ